MTIACEAVVVTYTYLMASPPKLRLIQGGPRPQAIIGSIRLYLGGQQEKPPFDPEIQVVEEDTWQVLSADNVAHEVDEHPIRLMTALIDQQPLAIGQVLKGRKCWRLVTTDFDQQISCRTEWIQLALNNLFSELQLQSISSLAMALPGVEHGYVQTADSVALLLDAIVQHQDKLECQMWLSVEPDNLPLINRQMASYLHE